MAVRSPCCSTRAFPSCCEQGLLSSCCVQASHCSDFFCCRAWTLGCTGSGVVAHSCLRACGILVSGPGIEPMSPALAGQFITTGPPEKSQAYFKWPEKTHLRKCCLFFGLIGKKAPAALEELGEGSILGTCMHAESLQLCPTLCDPMDCSPPGSSVRGPL